MRILGIETSCDETAAAVVENGRTILSSIVASQDEIHGKYGGIVPELASRRHIAAIHGVVEKALERAGLRLPQIDGIAVTHAPGLIGSLLVGLSFAKALAYSNRIPWVGIHHIEGHLTAALLGEAEPSFPLVGLVASGGHTNIYRMPRRGTYELLAQTLDDAAGEAFDKVAKLLGLPYPGGPAVDAAAEGGRPDAVSLPRAVRGSLNFSFSGLKTAVAQRVRTHGIPTGKALADLAASFQEAVVDVLLSKLFEAAERHEVSDIAVCGGVARNRRFRALLEKESDRRGLRLFLAPPDLCTDNAVMVAAAGYARLSRNESDPLSLNAVATLPVPNV